MESMTVTTLFPSDQNASATLPLFTNTSLDKDNPHYVLTDLSDVSGGLYTRVQVLGLADGNASPPTQQSSVAPSTTIQQRTTAEFRVDTGSFATVLPLSLVREAISDFDVDAYPVGSLEYSSDDLTEHGVWVPLTLAFPDARLPDGTLPTTTVTALVSTGRPAFMLGVGFDVSRGSASTIGHVLTGADNAFLNLAAMAEGEMARSYAITREGIVLGATAGVDGNGWVTQQLQPAPPGSTSHATIKEWQLAQVTASLDGAPHGAFELLLDTGLNKMFFEFEGGSQVAHLPSGHVVEIDLSGSTAGSIGYSFSTIGDSSQKPTIVTFENPREGHSFVNTGANVLTGFDYLYDADAGLIGLRSNGAGRHTSIDLVPAQAIDQSGYLDAGAWRLADPDATGVTNALHLRDVHQASAGDTVVMALAVGRANDPTSVLNLPWAERQQILTSLAAEGTLWSTYGGKPEDYAALKATLGNFGRVLTAADGYVDNDTRTVWVELTASSFSALFGQTLMSGSAEGGDHVHFWEGELSSGRLGVPVDALWFDGLAIPSVPAPQAGAAGIEHSLAIGPQSSGNAASDKSDYFPHEVAGFYGFPSQTVGLSAKTPAVGILAPGLGDATASSDMQTLVDAYRTAAGVSGSGQVHHGTTGLSPQETKGGERSLDIGVVSTAVPNSDIVLYSGTGHVISAMQEAIWDEENRIGVLSSSYSVSQQARQGSPFQKAYSELAIDAALRNITLVNASGDGGSSAEYANGIPMVSSGLASPYTILVGGTSVASAATAATDPTLADLLSRALSHDRGALYSLIAGGLTALPDAGDNQPALETVWNQYEFMNGAVGYPLNLASAGGVDATQTPPGYQSAFGLELTSAGPLEDGGRGLPDVAALAGGNARYIVPGPDMVFDANDPTTNGGTSASAPLWAALITQISAIFQDQGLPSLGYANDLLYQAAAIAPGAFNDVVLGNNVSSFVLGGNGTVLGLFKDEDDKDVFGYPITPTGLGYSAGPGYDLTTGLGSPNGVLLARALTGIAHTQMQPLAPALLDADGLRSAVTQSLLVQPGVGSALPAATASMEDSAYSSGAVPASLAWSDAFAQKSLQPGFDPDLIRLFDGDAQATPHDILAAEGSSFAGAARQASLTSPFGFADYAGTDGMSQRYARPVAVAQTAHGTDDQEAVVRIRRNAANDLNSVEFYKVDNLTGEISGIAPGQSGYEEAAASRSYQTALGTTSVSVSEWGGYVQTALLNVDAGDLIAMRLSDGERSYWGFSSANEAVGGVPVTHLWSYGYNTWGWEDMYGGGDQDFNDLVVQIDFTSSSGSQWLM
jgi:hypothetical protein